MQVGPMNNNSIVEIIITVGSLYGYLKSNSEYFLNK